MTDIRQLVARMDLDQKIAQIQGVVPMDLVDFAKLVDPAAGVVPRNLYDLTKLIDPAAPPPDFSKGFPYDIDRLPLVRPHGVGHLSMGWQLSSDLDELRRKLARFQEVAREVNPFGIATLVHGEGVNGFVHPQGYQFTTPWGQAATWDPSVSRT